MSDSSTTPQSKPWFWFSVWLTLSLILFINPVLALVRLSISHSDASHLLVVPFLSGAVLYLDREKVFQKTSTDKTLGASFLFLAGLVVVISYTGKSGSSTELQLSARILGLALLWVSGFAFLFGKSALRAAVFPFFFLLLMVPIPTFILDRIISFLQESSAWITGEFFDLVGVPALREGLVFHLAKVNIEVAKECSGIRSSMALLILALLASHFSLKSLWSKTLFVACGLFMMIVKNGIRIATLTLLAMYVDPGFLFGRLHQQGGVVFFLLALLLLLPLLFFLQRLEANKVAVAGRVQSPSA